MDHIHYHLVYIKGTNSVRTKLLVRCRITRKQTRALGTVRQMSVGTNSEGKGQLLQRPRRLHQAAARGLRAKAPVLRHTLLEAHEVTGTLGERGNHQQAGERRPGMRRTQTMTAATGRARLWVFERQQDTRTHFYQG